MAANGFSMEFDADFYRNLYRDLRSMSEADAAAHFQRYGIREGRQGSPLAVRENLLGALKRRRSILEIGPFCSPVVRGRNVAYFDVLDRDGAAGPGRAHRPRSGRRPRRRSSSRRPAISPSSAAASRRW